MRTHPLLRKRTPQTRIALNPAAGTVAPPINPAATRAFSASGAMALIKQGLFGIPDSAQLQEAPVALAPGHGASVYAYHQGDLFFPGTGNYVFDYPWELPMNTIWGHGFLTTVNKFNPYQPPQLYSQANVLLNGIGGLVAGSMALQPLESNGE
jgi:hypothetical protein